MPAGIVPEIVPSFVEDNVPISTAEAKFPLEFDNWALKSFPDVKVPVIVNGTETVAPAQNGEPLIVPVVIELAELTITGVEAELRHLSTTFAVTVMF